MRLIYIPLENIEQRYSVMMNASLDKFADIIIYPEFNYSGLIEKGQFLDINKTCIFKAKQLQLIAEMFYKEEVKDGDVFLIADIFFPGIESIKYMAELQGIKVKIFGFNYAGRADKTDFVQGLGKWADSSELGYHKLCDGIFVGSKFHKENIERHWAVESLPKIFVTGYIIDFDFMNSIFKPTGNKKENFVIWPHRICEEKGYEDLLQYADMTDKKIIVTSSGNLSPRHLEHPNIEYRSNLTKKEYYEILDKAEFYLSTAYQETFGYTLQEAIHFRCKVVVPERACYPEFVALENIYRKVEEIDDLFSNISYENIESLKIQNHFDFDRNCNDVIEIIKSNV